MGELSVKILFVTYANDEIEKRCLLALRKYTHDDKGIVMVDGHNGKSLTKIWNEEIEKADSDFILLVNSDVIVTPEYLQKMMKVMDNEKIAVVSPSTCQCGSRQKLSEYTDKRYDYSDVDIEGVASEVWDKYGEELVDTDVSGFCYLLRKRAWQEVGKFNEFFSFYGQESELNHRLVKGGWRVVWAKGIYVHHFGGHSIATVDSDKVKEEKLTAKLLYDFYTKPAKLNELKSLKRLDETMDKGRACLIRYGDGELRMMAGWEGKKRNQFNSPEIKKRLNEVYRHESPDYFIGLTIEEPNPYLNAKFGSVEEVKMAASYVRKEYLDANFFHKLSVYHPDLLIDFWKRRLSGKNILVIGNYYLKLPFLHEFIGIPKRQAYYSMDVFMPEALEKAKKADVILVGGGIAGKIIAYELYRNSRATVIDVGSWIDMFNDDISRSWLVTAQNEIKIFKDKFYEAVCNCNTKVE